MATLTPRLDKLDAGTNLVINGNMDFWQRGTTVSVGSGVNQYQADRFLVRRDFGNAPTYSRSTDVPTLAQSGHKSNYSLLLTNNSTGTAPTGTQSISVKTNLEGFDYAVIHGKKVRLQFWVKSSVSGTYSIAMASGIVNRCYVTTYSITAANTWEKKFVDITMDTVDANFAFDNTAGLSIWWSLSTGATRQTSSLNTWSDTFFSGSTTDTNTWSSTNSSTFQLAQVMLVPTTGALPSAAELPFQRAGRTIGDELRMCERYYEKSYQQNIYPGALNPTADNNRVRAYGKASSATALDGVYESFKVRKRVTPTITFYQHSSGASGNWVVNGVNSTVTAGGSGVDGECTFQANTSGGSGLTATQMYQAVGHWTADAEL